MTVRPAKTQISLGIRPVWSESSLCAQWVAKDPSFLHADSEDSDQIGRMPRLIWVFAGYKVILLVLSRGGSFIMVVWIYLTYHSFTVDLLQIWCAVVKLSTLMSDSISATDRIRKHTRKALVRFCWCASSLEHYLFAYMIDNYRFSVVRLQLEHLSRNTTNPTKWHVRTARTQISRCLVWSAWRNLQSSAIHWAHSKHSDQTGQILWSDRADAQADLSLRCVHRPFCWFLSCCRSFNPASSISHKS